MTDIHDLGNDPGFLGYKSSQAVKAQEASCHLGSFSEGAAILDRMQEYAFTGSQLVQCSGP